MQHEGWNTNGWKDVAHVDLAVHPHQHDGGCGTGTEPLKARPPLLEALVRDLRRREGTQARASSPRLLDLLQERLKAVRGQNPGVEVGVGAIQDQRLGSFGVGRSKEHAHCATFRDAEEGCSLAAHCVHDGSDIVHAFFEGRQGPEAVREPGPALVEQDEAAE